MLCQSIRENPVSKNEKKNQNHPKNKNLSDNCRAVIAHRSVLRPISSIPSNSLCLYCPLSHERGRGAGSFARERILLREDRYGRLQRECHVVRDASGVWFVPGKIDRKSTRLNS